MLTPIPAALQYAVDRKSMVLDWADQIGPTGNASACNGQPLGDAWCRRPAPGTGPGNQACPFTGIWCASENLAAHAWLRCFGTAWPRIIADRWDNATRTLARQVTKYLTTYKQAGGELDHLIQDVSRLSLLLLCCHSFAHPRAITV